MGRFGEVINVGYDSNTASSNEVVVGHDARGVPQTIPLDAAQTPEGRRRYLDDPVARRLGAAIRALSLLDSANTTQRL